MKRNIVARLLLFLGISVYCLALSSVGEAAVAPKSFPAMGSIEDEPENLGAGRVYVMTNDASANMIVVFRRDTDGSLTRMQEVFTGGRGSGPGPLPVEFGGPGAGPLPLDSQDSLVETEDHRFLLAVNAGSNELAVLAITQEGLQLIDKAPTMGIFPISIARHQGLVYVLNLGAPKAFSPSPSNPNPNITGFLLDLGGKLHAIPGSTRVTGGPLSVPDDIVLSPDGKLLVISELLANSIGVYPVDAEGRTGERITVPSNAPSPFGMAFDGRHTLAVVEANEIGDGIGVPADSTTSTYHVTEDGDLQPISVAVPSTQTAGCWIRFTRHGRLAYTVSAGSGAVSSYLVSPKGELSLLQGLAADTGGPFSVPGDFDITPDGKFLYVEAGFAGAVLGFRIEEDGSLTPVAKISGFPITIQGLIAQ